MSIFTNSFFSVKGQKERISNVVQTVKASITGQGVVANTSNKTVNKVLSTAASNPLVTAGAVAVAINPVSAGTAIKTGVSKLPTSAKVAGIIAAPVVASAVIANPKIVSKVSNTPKALSNLGTNIGKLSANPTAENAKELLKENPILVGTALAGTALVAGAAVTGAATNIANTLAIKENTRVAQQTLEKPILTEVPALLKQQEKQILTSELLPKSVEPSKNTALVPITPQTQVLGKSASSTVIKKNKKRKTLIKKNPSNNVNVKIYNQTKSLYIPYHNRY